MPMVSIARNPFRDPMNPNDVLNELDTEIEETLFPQSYPVLDRANIVWSVYSDPGPVTYNPSGQGGVQRHLRNRISYTVTDEGTATYYSYDPHGNVEWVIQRMPMWRPQPGQPKYMDNYIRYEYDLISGSPLRLLYNEGMNDQYFHRYVYDPDNRLVKVETSRDGRIWDGDARYKYFLHGPVKRVELGDDEVQGIDYTYTIHGWTKGINHPALGLDITQDPGRDGTANRYAEDAFGMTVGYYAGDFHRVFNMQSSGFNSGGTLDGNPLPESSYNLSNATHPLYNGNISTWASNIVPAPLPGPGVGGPNLAYQQYTGYQYQYDKLNRLRVAEFLIYDPVTPAWNYGVAETNPPVPPAYWQIGTEYSSEYHYDPNGNILGLKRLGLSAPGSGYNPELDDLAYTYNDYTSNQLKRVNDGYFPAAQSPYLLDMNDQLVPPFGPWINYVYDARGNLMRDEQEGVVINWRPDGKVRTVRKNILQPGTTGGARVIPVVSARMDYLYDPLGQRVRKVIRNRDQQTWFKGGTWTTTEGNKVVYYVRDANGEVLAVYEQEILGHNLNEEMNGETPDTDGDGVPDWMDNLPTEWNVDQEDFNHDETGDACDWNPALAPYIGNWVPVVPSGNPFPPLLPCVPGPINGDQAIPFGEVTLKEWMIYGAEGQGRFVTVKPKDPTTGTHGLIRLGENSNPPMAEGLYTRNLREKYYELKDHLGNVRVTFTDLKEPTGVPGQLPFTVDMASYNNYYAFGMLQPGRSWSSDDYRYGFNGKEMDNEWYGTTPPVAGMPPEGTGNSYDYGFRIYNPRYARFLSVDPLADDYPWYTPYQFAGDNPIAFIDLDGLEESIPLKVGTVTTVTQVNSRNLKTKLEGLFGLASAGFVGPPVPASTIGLTRSEFDRIFNATTLTNIERGLDVTRQVDIEFTLGNVGDDLGQRSFNLTIDVNLLSIKPNKDVEAQRSRTFEETVSVAKDVKKNLGASLGVSVDLKVVEVNLGVDASLEISESLTASASGTEGFSQTTYNYYGTFSVDFRLEATSRTLVSTESASVPGNPRASTEVATSPVIMTETQTRAAVLPGTGNVHSETALRGEENKK